MKRAVTSTRKLCLTVHRWFHLNRKKKFHNVQKSGAIGKGCFALLRVSDIVPTSGNTTAIVRDMEAQEFTPDEEMRRLIDSLQAEIDNINVEVEMLTTRHELMTKWQAALRRGSTETVPLPRLPPRL